jgi:hypothetical protein
MEYRVIARGAEQETTVRIVELPALAGVRARGYVIADDRSWSLTLEPVDDD